ncbi:hypothetical protein [Aeromonas veronii]|uniref:hypothetical protein n=1 Tax=Aeromonas veronii TaxID=654 RepID=UPI003006C814
MSVSGLAEGYLAGFSTTDRYLRGQKEDERADQAMSLRDAMWQNEQDQQKKADARYDDETKYNRGRDAIGDKRYSLEYADKQRQLELENNRANAMLSINAEQNRRAQESHALAVEKNKRDQWWFDNEVPFNMAIEALGRREQITPEQDALLNHEYAAGRNPFRVFGDPQWHKSSETVYQGMKAIIENPDAKVWDMGKMHGAINTPEIKKSLTYMVKGNLEKGIGTVTPNGVVKSYGEVEVVPTGRGTFFLQAPVTYVNPKTGEEIVKDAPITEGRTGDLRDPVKELTAQQFIQYFGKARQISQQIQKNPDQWDNYLVQTGMKPPADYKGLKAALADLYKQEAKALADGGDPATVKAAFDEARENLPSVYGVGTGGAHNESSGENNNTGIVSQWANQDPIRVGFIDEVRRKGIPIDSVKDPAQLDSWLAKYNQSKQASSTAGRIREETAKTTTRTSLSQANKDSKTQRAGAYSQEYRKPLEMEPGALSLRDLESPFSLPSNDAYVPAWARGPAK